MPDTSKIEDSALSLEALTPQNPHIDPHTWGYTQNLRELLGQLPIGYKNGAPIYSAEGLRIDDGKLVIGRDTPINGGVLIEKKRTGEPLSELISVDDNKQDGLIRTYQTLDRMIKDQIGNLSPDFKKEIFDNIINLTRHAIPYDQNGLDKLYEKYRIKPGDYVPLEFNIRNEKGVCRHQALLAGYLLEKLILKNIIDGLVSFDSNYGPSDGHAWVRYTLGNQVIILDPAKEFWSPLSQANAKGQWDYLRPEDREKTAV